MPLDVARSAFEWLVAGPHPLSVDGCLFPGFPARRVPLSEARDRLLRRRCPQALRDAVWSHLVLLTRTEGAVWVVGAVGVGLPALTSIAATLTARFAADPSDIHAAVLAGFVAELGEIELRRPRIMLRLRWAAYRAGHTALREALDAPVPSGHGFGSATPPPPWGHPDFVLARAVAERAVTAAEAELIGATRLEGVPLADAALACGLSYEAAKKARQRAERRLVAYLRGDAVSREDDVVTRVADTVLLNSATPALRAVGEKRRRVSPRGRDSGVQGCGSAPAAPAHTTTDSPGLPQRSSGSNPGVPRCA
ncbi:hypothetical protein [Saccharothrix variisporea]|uniref:DNA-directed RNA polymerase specialized sigma24 family protein n=1 Tax=Saccharothrix variisporea TaxID=543527 RepID=A0A495X8N5_9PSEU|nr:hypothetical protein [Saccharothrix variisporea]RKT69515.1 hypothetical protein DFJ66_2746 [Saccharothrix variisporea]